jgi:hypothetical protein
MSTHGQSRNEYEPDKGLNVTLFLCAFFGTFTTMHLLVVPAILVCALFSILRKTPRLRWAAGSFMLGIVAEMITFAIIVGVTGNYDGLPG